MCIRDRRQRAKTQKDIRPSSKRQPERDDKKNKNAAQHPGKPGADNAQEFARQRLPSGQPGFIGGKLPCQFRRSARGRALVWINRAHRQKKVGIPGDDTL